MGKKIGFFLLALALLVGMMASYPLTSHAEDPGDAPVDSGASDVIDEGSEGPGETPEAPEEPGDSEHPSAPEGEDDEEEASPEELESSEKPEAPEDPATPEDNEDCNIHARKPHFAAVCC